MKGLEKFIAANKKLWDNWAKIHTTTKNESYDIDAFCSGKTSLTKIELTELGDVKEKFLLHLQCHFGLDTLSWAREGAIVTGVDLSTDAIDFARSLSQKMNMTAEFVCSDIYNLPNVLKQKFDVVFTSYGVLNWLADLDKWAEIVAQYLKPNGTFYIVEFHPFTHMFDAEWKNITDSYFSKKEPRITEEKGSYANREVDFTGIAYEWSHPLSEIMTALRKANLVVEFCHEFPYSPHDCFPSLEKTGEGEYSIKDKSNHIPLIFSIKATYMPELALT